MNIYEKLTVAKKTILEANLKKSGENKFAGFKYYELSDITPKIIANISYAIQSMKLI